MFNTYIVTDTKINEEELEKLKTKGLPIIFLDDPESYYDEVGGFHSCAIGWNPNSVWCGECTKASCKDCDNRDTTEEFIERLRNV